MAPALQPDSQTTLQANSPAGWADLPEDLLVSVFNTLRHPRDLMACACVCKAWRIGESKAFQPVMDDLDGHDCLDWLMRLTLIQLAAVRDVRLSLYYDDQQAATASAMILAFISRGLPRLQQLLLDWDDAYGWDADWAQVGCRADA